MSKLLKGLEVLASCLWNLFTEALCHLPMALTIATVLYLFNVIIVI